MKGRRLYNPVEVIAFAGLSVAFLTSVYNLFLGEESKRLQVQSRPTEATIDGAQTSATSSVQPNQAQAGTPDARSPASVAHYPVVEIPCDSTSELKTRSARVKIAGDSCIGDEILSANIVNEANKAVATVFSHGGRYSTDPMAVNTGKNPLVLDLHLKSGKKLTREILLTRED